jgi:hypothetical protein
MCQRRVHIFSIEWKSADFRRLKHKHGGRRQKVAAVAHTDRNVITEILAYFHLLLNWIAPQIHK